MDARYEGWPKVKAEEWADTLSERPSSGFGSSVPSS